MGLRQTAAFLFTLLAMGAHGASFTPGNLVVYRVGVPGGPNLVATGNPVFLDEYALSPSGTAATLVQSIALPTAVNGSNRPLVASGTATTDGLLTRSTDGNCLAVTGYGRDIGVTTGNLTSTAGIPRIVAKVTAQATIDSTTALTDAAAAPPTATNFRGAASADCAAFWTAGSAAGIRYATLGATTSADLGSAAFPNIRAVSIFGGQLYASASVANPTLLRNVATVGSGLPVSGPQALVKLPGLADTTTNSPYAFFLADLDPGVPGFDTLYVADDDVGALTKYALVGGSWSAKGTIGTAADTYRGLTGVVTDDRKVILFATRKGGSGTAGGGELVTLTDASGYNGAFTGTPTIIATAASKTAFRGVALAPGVVTITPSAGAHGSISPATPQVVPGSTTSTFTVTPDAGYSSVVGGTCNGTLAGNTYTTRPATVDCTVAATFVLVTRTVTPSASANGTISPSSPQSVPLGATASFDVAAAFGYSASVGGSCGGTLSGNTFTTLPVTVDCTVAASFTIITHTVTPSAGANGTISPDSAQAVAHGSTASFSVAPASGYAASVGGTCGGTLSGNTYTTNAVTADCTVAAAFTPLPTYVVTPLAGANGTVTPNAPRSVMSGQTTSFTVIPAPGYNFAVRGTCGGSLAGDTYTTYPVARDCSVAFAFAKKLVLFVGNSYTFGRVDPVMSYNADGVTDLTYQMWLANADGSNADEPHPWGGIPGVFKKLTDQAGLDYDVSISARNAASLRGHYLNSNPAGWDLRGNIASQRWDTVMLQDLSDEPLPANRGANANLPYFNGYVDKIETWIHGGAAESYTETQLFGNGSDITCNSVTGASLNACNTLRVVAPANTNARAQADVFLYQTWARPDMIGPNGTNGPAPGTHYYTAAEGLEAMTADFHAAYFGRAAANPNIDGVSPVGDAFLRAVQDGVAMRDPYVPEAGKINLWHTDYFHPSKYGSYLSALVHFATLTGLDPMTLGAAEQAAADLGISPAIAVQLQRVARATVMPDATPPTTTASVSPPANGQGWNQGSVTVTFTAVDNTSGWGVSSINYSLGGAQPGSGSVPAGGSVTLTAEGETTISYFATDLAGNAETARTLVIRIDSTAPTLSVPASFSVEAAGPDGTSVGYDVTAADSSGLAPSIACLPASGSILPIGTSTIACSATDAAGNSASASFNVTVVVPIVTVTPSAGAHGSIAPDSAQVIPRGTTTSFDVAAAPGYSASVAGTCGGTLTGNTFTTAPAPVSCTVIATFTPLPTYTVTPIAGAHGTVTPNVPRSVIVGQATSFTVTPEFGYQVAIRGTCGGAIAGDTFTTNPVSADCSVRFAFAEKLVLFVGDSFTTGRVDPVTSYDAANVTDLTHPMWLANPAGSNADEPHPCGGIPGVFKKLTDQAGLDYDVSISARSAATLRDHYVDPTLPGWDLRVNIASQKWGAVVLQDLGDEPLPAGSGANANLPSFDAYVDRIESWIHSGAATSEAPANPNANPQAEVFLYQTWARPGILDAMTRDLHDAYFGRAAANPRIEDVAPVGDAFLLAVQQGIAMRDPSVPEVGKINLWHTDAFHPSKYGSYLSALVHFATITGLDPMSLGGSEQAALDLGISPAVAAQLQRVARAAVTPDSTPPLTTATVSPPANGQGWNRENVVVTFAAADNAGGWGVSFITYVLGGAEAATGTVPPGGSITISAEGETTVTYFATDIAGNVESPRALRLAIDKSAPVVSGMPGSSCSLWPPNHEMVAVATIGAASGVSPITSLNVAVASNEPPAPGEGDVAISGPGSGPRTLSLRAERDGNGSGRVYTISVSAIDAAGNSATATATCVVPHDQRK